MALEGDLVRLREEREDDLQLLVDLRNDLETQAWSRTLAPDFTLHMYRQRHEERGFSFRRSDGRFIIELIETGEPVGYTGYYNLSPRLGVTFGLSVAKEWWGSGVALDMQEVLLKFFFEELGLRVVRLYTHSGNPAAVRLAQKSGFRIAVRHREAIFKDGQLFDNLVMDLLREEYYGRHPELEDHMPVIGNPAAPGH